MFIICTAEYEFCYFNNHYYLLYFGYFSACDSYSYCNLDDSFSKQKLSFIFKYSYQENVCDYSNKRFTLYLLSSKQHNRENLVSVFSTNIKSWISYWQIFWKIF